MFKFFDAFFDFLGVIGDFISSTFSNIIAVFGYISQGLQIGAMAVTFMPTLVKAVALAIISYAVIINVLNKGG